MNIHGGPSALGLQHMAARAQEVRKQFPSTPTSTTTEETGNNLPTNGGNLPTVTDSAKPEHMTGLEHAIEQLQKNAEKSPDAKGLQNALEMLQRNLASQGGTIDTAA